MRLVGVRGIIVHVELQSTERDLYECDEEQSCQYKYAALLFKLDRERGANGLLTFIELCGQNIMCHKYHSCQEAIG